MLIRRLAITLGSLLLLANLSAQWTRTLLPKGQQARHGNSIYIIDAQNAIVAGGHRTVDSIQYFARTANGGSDWALTLDSLAPWLKSVCFTNSVTGFAVGRGGTIMRTTDAGNTWNYVAAPGNTAGRHFSSVVFLNDSIGFIAGGNLSNDSIQTILKTADGGNSWGIQRDIPGYMLNAIYFVGLGTGYAVGNNGVVLKTVDGGQNWNALTLTGNMASRSFNCLQFINADTGIIAGGNRTGDSIQTILKTTDGGANWSIVKDIIAPMLNGIDFASKTKAYLVGDHGVFLTSDDAGSSWAPVAIPSAIDDTILSLNAVHFLTPDFGMAVGDYGKVFKYANLAPTFPTDSTLAATEITDTSAQLNGLVNANGSNVAVSFEYGTTPSFGSNVIASPDSVFGNLEHVVSANITGLVPGTTYYYRVKAETNGTAVYGAMKTLFTAYCEIPNCDFEFWDTVTAQKPLLWKIAGTTRQTTSYNGTIAVELYAGDENNIGGIILGGPGPDDGIGGGIPFNERPDSIVFYARYDIAAGDTAFVMAFFKVNTVIINQVVVPITGNSGGNFIEIKQPISFPTLDVPDSLIMLAVSTNAFNGANNPASILALDDIRFTGTALTLPNPGFEIWDTITYKKLKQWRAREDEKTVPDSDTSTMATQTTDAVSENYALHLSNNISKFYVAARVSMGDDNNGKSPTFAVGARHTTLNMFVKYFPESNDSLVINLGLFYNGDKVGGIRAYIDTSILNYTALSFDINYTQQVIPDSAALDFSVGIKAAKGNSELYIDNISFDGFRKIAKEDTLINNIGNTITLDAVKNAYCLVYPNPATDILNIDFYSETGASEKLELFDYSGRKMMDLPLINVVKGINHRQINIATFHAGSYILSIANAGNARKYRIIRR